MPGALRDGQKPPAQPGPPLASLMTTVDASLGPLAPAEPKVQADVIPMAFVACVSDEAVLKANLMASPVKIPGDEHRMK